MEIDEKTVRTDEWLESRGDMSSHPIPVCFVLAACWGLPSASAAASGDATRFEHFARSAHASGSLTLTLRFAGDPVSCATHDTCGRSGTVTTRLRFASERRLRVGHAVVGLPVRGGASAHTRDTASGSACASKGSVPFVGLRFAADARGLLLRLAGALGVDPFATSCRSPRLADLGASALPAVRLRRVARRVNTIRLTFRATREATGGGYTGRVSTRGRINLRR